MSALEMTTLNRNLNSSSVVKMSFRDLIWIVETYDAVVVRGFAGELCSDLAREGHIRIVSLLRGRLGFDDVYEELFWYHHKYKFSKIHKELFWYHHKHKFSKKIYEEMLPIAWHPDRFWNWCFDEDEKRVAEKLWVCETDSKLDSKNA